MNILEKKKKVKEKLFEISKEVSLTSLDIEWVSYTTMYNLLNEIWKSNWKKIEKMYNFLEKNKYFST